MQASQLIQSINQTGIEHFLGGTPIQLPAQLQVEETVLSNAKSVVRAEKVSYGNVTGQILALLNDGVISLIKRPSVTSQAYESSTLAETNALLDEIQRIAPIAYMPQAAFDVATLTLGDAEVVYDELPGPSSYTASFFMVSDGLTQEDAEQAFDTMRTASLAARISFMSVQGDEVALTYGIWIGQDGGDVWMATVSPPVSTDFTLETVMQGAFRKRLLAGVKSLAGGA